MPSPTPAPNTAKRPVRRSSTRRRIVAVTSLGLAGFLAGLLSGCGTGIVPGAPSATSFSQATGNWQFSSSSLAAARLSAVGGILSVSGSAITGFNVSGILHPLPSANSQCLPSTSAINVAGSIDAASRLDLTSSIAGGTLNLAGTLAPDRRSLSDATFTITGGACASTSTLAARSAPLASSPKDANPPVTAQQYQPVSGTYTGTLTSSAGETFALTSSLTQTSQPDSNGVYHVNGSAASPGNTCVPATLSATASNLDGGGISTTYTDAATSTSISASGTSSPDASTLTISSWTINSPCGSDSGTGTLTRQ